MTSERFDELRFQVAKWHVDHIDRAIVFGLGGPICLYCGVHGTADFSGTVYMPHAESCVTKMVAEIRSEAARAGWPS